MPSNEALELIEQVLNEGRFKDAYISKTREKENDLDIAIANNNIYKVNELLRLYKQAKKFLEDAKTKEKTKDGSHYWTLPNWLIALLVPVEGIAINACINSKKTKFTDQEIGRIEEAFDRCIAKAEAFLAEDFTDNKTKHEAAMILIEALNTLLNE